MGSPSRVIPSMCLAASSSGWSRPRPMGCVANTSYHCMGAGLHLREVLREREELKAGEPVPADAVGELLRGELDLVPHEVTVGRRAGRAAELTGAAGEAVPVVRVCGVGLGLLEPERSDAEGGLLAFVGGFEDRGPSLVVELERDVPVLLVSQPEVLVERGDHPLGILNLEPSGEVAPGLQELGDKLESHLHDGALGGSPRERVVMARWCARHGAEDTRTARARGITFRCWGSTRRSGGRIGRWSCS